jgi:hypothetical protein
MPRIPILFCFLFFFVFFEADGQVVNTGSTYAIRIDSLTRQPDKPIPFDQPFTIILNPRNPQAITSILAIGLKIGNHGIPEYKLGSADIRIQSFKVVGQQVVIDFYPVKANTSFDIYIQRKLDGLLLTSFMNFAGYVVNNQINPRANTPDEKSAMDARYFDFYNALVPYPDTYSNVSADPKYQKLVIARFLYDYLFVADCEADKSGDCRSRSLEDHMNLVITGNISAIIKLKVQPDISFATYNFLADLIKISKTYLANRMNDQTISSVIRIWTNNKTDDFFQGLISADYQDRDVSGKPEDVGSRQINFQITCQKLFGLRDTLNRLLNEIPSPDVAFTRAITYLNDLIDKFYSTKKTTDDKIKEITIAFLNLKALYYPEYYVNNANGFKDLQSTSASYFSAQVGLSFLGMEKNLGGYQVIPKIALGVNINFKAINKSLNRRDIPNKDWRNYISGFVGVTFGSFSDPQYNNLLASNSLIVGLNYRVARSFYFSLGASAFRQQNKNPLITGYHNEFGAYASLMLDLDLTSAASNVVSIFTK